MVHLQQYRRVAVTTLSIINEERFLIMAIYSHPCVCISFAGRYGSLHGNKDTGAMLTDASAEKQKKITENNNYANLRWNNYGRIHYL